MAATEKPSKRRKRDKHGAQDGDRYDSHRSSQARTSSFADTHKPQKPSAIAKAGPGRSYTLSIALPGSILLNAQSPELRTHLAGQIARACAIFSVDEIVVFHEPNHLAVDAPSKRQKGKYRQTASDLGTGDANDMDSLLGRILEYLETPQYLRRALIPMHPSLRLAGLLPPLDMHHHLRKSDIAPFRVGVVIDRPAEWKPSFGQPDHSGAFVDVGLDVPMRIQAESAVGTRLTVRMTEPPEMVPPDAPTHELGLNWGYTVRYADSVSKVLLECPYAGGYDWSIGTSERGQSIEEVSASAPRFRHALLVFGGLAGLELTIESDGALGLSANDAADAFDAWTNILPGQGSRTIRTEEALMIALSRLKPVLDAKGLSE